MKQTKICTKCNVAKPLLDFGKKRSHSSGFNPQCKECVSEYNRLRYENNGNYKALVLERARLRQADKFREPESKKLLLETNNSRNRSRYQIDMHYRESLKSKSRIYGAKRRDDEAYDAFWMRMEQEAAEFIGPMPSLE